MSVCHKALLFCYWKCRNQRKVDFNCKINDSKPVIPLMLCLMLLFVMMHSLGLCDSCFYLFLYLPDMKVVSIVDSWGRVSSQGGEPKVSTTASGTLQESRQLALCVIQKVCRRWAIEPVCVCHPESVWEVHVSYSCLCVLEVSFSCLCMSKVSCSCLCVSFRKCVKCKL